MDDVLFRCVDHWGRTIVLGADTWNLHILPNRPLLVGNQDLVKATLTDPSDVMFDATHEARESYYRPMTSPRTGRRLYLKVCVEFVTEEASSLAHGQVVTAYPTPKIKRGEQPKWNRQKIRLIVLDGQN